MAATAQDAGALLVRIEASQAKFEKQMAAIAARAAKDAGNIERSFRQANDNAARGFDRSGKQVEKSLGAQRAAVANLSFQLNDITQGLLSGTSPFTIMVQQGSQVAQALQGAGGGLVGAVKTLGGAFAQMVNPVSLASFAVIGLTGAAVKYFMSLRGDTKDANELLKAHAELIRSFDAAFGIAEGGAKRYSATLKAVELQKLRDEFGNLREAIKGAADELKGDILSIPASAFGGATKSIDDMNRALTLLERDVPDFSGFAAAMSTIENSNAPASVKDLAKQFRVSAQEQIALQEAVESTDSKLRAVTTSGETVRKTFEALTSAALGWGKGGADAIDTVVNKVRGDLIPAMTQAAGQLLDYLKHFVTLQDQINRSPLGSVPPVFSGGGQFLNPDELNTFKANQGQLQAAGASAAAQMLRGFEGFISKAKWDKNHFRVGFGSDTTTRANGQIEEVTKDTIVTLEDAQRDLSRRIVEFQDGIQQAIGIDTWKSLSDAQQAALTSIAYNYGKLPKSIVAAINGGGGPEVVAKAIAGLSANPTRRSQEASAYLSGTGYSMSSVGLSGKSPAEVFQGNVADVQKRIDMLNAEYAAQAKLNPLINDYGYAVQKARTEQQLLSEAQKAGIEITPQLREQISQLAENYAKATAASGALSASNGRLIQSMQESSAFGKDVLGGFIQDLKAGKSASEALANALNKVADKLLDIGLNALFDGSKAGSGGGIFGGLFSWLFPFANGGIAKNGRPQPLQTFANGGVSRTAAIFGETGRAEAAVPLPDGRRIPVDLRAPEIRRGGGSTDVVRVVLQDDSGRMAGIADQRIQTHSGTIVQVAVQQSTKTVRGQLSGMIADTQARQM